MAVKLSSRQQAQVAYLELMPPKIQKMKTVIEQMSTGTVDDVFIRGLGRQLDEMRIQAQGFGLGRVADVAGQMGMMARRGGSVHVKARGLRELLAGLRIAHEAALKTATTPVPRREGEPEEE